MPKKLTPEAAKSQQGYREPSGCCFECARFRVDRTIHRSKDGDHVSVSPPRCMLGNFEVKRTATCNEFEVPF